MIRNATDWRLGNIIVGLTALLDRCVCKGEHVDGALAENAVIPIRVYVEREMYDTSCIRLG